ncbi:MBL fold metallo-hydrolase [Domibacillus sp. DTU_2020_1001157_1_SI_ALB_TIR_016]|uniref:MBL fold metallo-hydrolase n=1 Tax=Domibacillus sp. DTU_2020_1001157_1_SI_ALB_TIR_016 TaxID=3077789 RepID=UPI0028E4F3A2|nr:MBL fold metallo-hydrolase [Domibacillus sp. DTU_2020_1001157_1_SI_ALB_TIR_016]WNS80080.1 MBL fold metallo-hydrolase [Domibacillus sp. DTU_2020_1001157_1_SI_ALB_TIR_016]
MNVTVLGCWGGFPKANEASSGYLVEHDGFKLLVDCGSAVLSKLQNHLKPADLNAVILSHYHADHVADIGVLQHALLIDSFTSKTREEPLAIYGHNEADGFQTLTYKNITKGVAYNPADTLQAGPFSISFFKTNHPASCYAIKITDGTDTVVYTADTAFQRELASFAQGADVLLAESNLYKGMDGSSAGHMTAQEAGILAREAQVKTLVLTHLPHFGELDQLVQEAGEEFSGPIMLARENLEIGF